MKQICHSKKNFSMKYFGIENPLCMHLPMLSLSDLGADLYLIGSDSMPDICLNMLFIFYLIGNYIRRVFNMSVGALLIYLSIPVVQNLISSRQRMNTSFEPLRLVNTYGAFGR